MAKKLTKAIAGTVITITADGKKYKVEIISHEPPKANIQNLNE